MSVLYCFSKRDIKRWHVYIENILICYKSCTNLLIYTIQDNLGVVFQETEAMEPASLENLCVLYHSANYIVVNKHWDIRIDSKMWYEKQTVQSQLKHRFPELADPDTYYGFRSFSRTFLLLCYELRPIII